MSEHHVSSITGKLNAKMISFIIYIFFTNVLRYPGNGAKANRLEQVSVMGELCSDKGQLHPLSSNPSLWMLSEQLITHQSRNLCFYFLNVSEYQAVTL